MDLNIIIIIGLKFCSGRMVKLTFYPKACSCLITCAEDSKVIFAVSSPYLRISFDSNMIELQRKQYDITKCGERSVPQACGLFVRYFGMAGAMNRLI